MFRIPTFVAVIASVISVIFLASAMVLLSTVIIWISLEFSGPIPHALGFILGILSLINSIVLIVVIGVPRIRKTLAFIFLVTSAVSLLAGAALIIPWVLEYTKFCDDCGEQTPDCVNNCPQECCFTDQSRPLAITFMALSAIVILMSIVGVAISVPYMRFNTDDNYTKQR